MGDLLHQHTVHHLGRGAGRVGGLLRDGGPASLPVDAPDNGVDPGLHRGAVLGRQQFASAVEVPLDGLGNDRSVLHGDLGGAQRQDHPLARSPLVVAVATR